MRGAESSTPNSATPARPAAPRRAWLHPREMWPAWDERASARMVVLGSGLRVRVVESGPRTGPPVLLLHGWGCSAYAFKELLVALGAAGYRAIAPDLQGHGLSDKPTSREAYGMDAMIAHVLEVMDALGIDRASLGGHSMGGGLAARIALAAPHRVDRLALLSPVGFGRIFLISLGRFAAAPWFAPVAPYLVRRRVIGLVLLAVYASNERVTARDVDEFYAPAQFPEFVPAMRALLRESVWEPLGDAQLAALTQPQLVLYGSRDVVIRFDERSPPLRPRPQLEVRRIEGAGHMAHAERHEEASAAVIQFLRSTTVAK